MSSIFKGLSIVVLATVVTSSMILMTGKSNADNKDVLGGAQSNKANKSVSQNKLSESVVAPSGNKTLLTVTPPPPPGPFFYGSTVGEGIGINAKNKVRANHGLHVNKPQKPATPILSSKPSAPIKPSKSVAQSSQAGVKSDQVVVKIPNIKVPKQVEQKLAPQQINNMSESALKAPSLQKAPNFKVERPKSLINNIKAPIIEKTMGSFKPEMPSMDMGGKPTLVIPTTPTPRAPSLGQLSAPKLKSIPELATKPSEVKPILPKLELPELQMQKPVAPKMKAPAPVPSVTAPTMEKVTQHAVIKPPQREGMRQRAITNPNIQRPMSPPSIVKAPVLRQNPPAPRVNSISSRTPPVVRQLTRGDVQPMQPLRPLQQQGSPQFAPPQPQNITPSYQMINPTMPAFYYYYPAPNYGYQFAPRVDTDTNITTNPRIRNNQGQQWQEGDIPPTMMQNNINPNNNFGVGRKN